MTSILKSGSFFQNNIKARQKKRLGFLINILVLVFGLTLIIHFTVNETSDNSKKNVSAFVRLTPQMTLGYSDLVADIYWLRVIQNFDYCENDSTEKSSNQGVTFDQALQTELKPSRCHRGWVFNMLDTITDLAPRLRVAYLNGVSSLVVAVDDREGARVILEKGLIQFPEDWKLAYLGAYIYLFEAQKPDRAADLLLQANRFGGPSWLPVLASRLYTSTGRQELGRSVLEEYLKTNPEGDGAIRARARLKELSIEK